MKKGWFYFSFFFVFNLKRNSSRQLKQFFGNIRYGRPKVLCKKSCYEEWRQTYKNALAMECFFSNVVGLKLKTPAVWNNFAIYKIRFTISQYSWCFRFNIFKQFDGRIVVKLLISVLPLIVSTCFTTSGNAMEIKLWILFFRVIPTINFK